MKIRNRKSVKISVQLSSTSDSTSCSTLKVTSTEYVHKFYLKKKEADGCDYEQMKKETRERVAATEPVGKSWL